MNLDRHDDDHHAGLVADLEVIGRHLVARRRALAWFAGVGVGALVSGCGGGSDGSSGSAGTSSTSTSSTASGTTTSTSASSSTSSSTNGSCIVDATETSGPYPADGTNTASGSTSNILTSSGIVRSDIRSSFISSTTTAQGVQLVLTLTLVSVTKGCAPLSGYAIYLWHCDASGDYSLYSAPTESYLRGVQVTDANGQASFTTIVPACYSGRYPHIHFEVYASLSAATSGRNATLISQLAMPSDICTAVFNGNSLYSASIKNFAAVSIGTDNVFGDDTAAQIAQMTPAFSGSLSAGYAATATIGI